MFNHFMISLGREAAGAPHDAPAFSMNHSASFDSSALSSGSSSSPSSEQSPLEDLFNPDELAKLGLGGMPGIPMSSSAPASFQFGGMYPSLDTNRNRAASTSETYDPTRRTIASLPRQGSSSATSSKFDFNQPPTNYHEPLDFNSDFSFDSLARPKQQPQATLAPRDFYKKTYRHVATLGASVSSRGMQQRESAERSSSYDEEDEVESDDMDIPTPKIPLASLIDGEESVRLPAIDHPDAEDGEDRPTLPSISTLDALHRPPVKRHTEDDILRGVKRLELRDGVPSPAPEDRSAPNGKEAPKDTRRRHAAIIRAWLVAVNLQYRKQKLEEMSEVEEDEDDE